MLLIFKCTMLNALNLDFLDREDVHCRHKLTTDFFQTF